MKKVAKKEDRHSRIISLLKKNDFLSTEQMIEILQCSLSTIRNDLIELEKSGALVRVLGGAKLVIPSGNPSVGYRLNQNQAAKEAVAKYVVDHYVTEKSTIILDAGTTALEVANEIRRRNLGLNVLTVSNLVLQVLSNCPKVQLYSFGGFYNHESAYFYDDFFLKQVKDFRADLYIMALNGVSPEAGFTITFRDEAVIKHAWMDIASKTIAVCDSSKVMRNACRVLTDFRSVSTMITDSMIAPEAKEKLEQSGLQIEICELSEYSVD